MAHSNKYFEMKSKFDSTRSISLISRDEMDENFNEVKAVQLVVKGDVYGTDLKGEIGIFLTEKEQNDLIIGILERRGVKPNATKTWLRYVETLDCPFPISPYANEQSKILPSITD